MILSVHSDKWRAKSINTLTSTGNTISNSTQKLSSGVRLNSAGEDSASLSIAARLQSDLKGVSQSSQNILSVMNHMETALSGINEAYDTVQRIRELFLQGINGTNRTQEKDALQREINELVGSLSDIVDVTQVNSYDLRPGGNNSDSMTQILNNTIPKRYVLGLQTGSRDDDRYLINFNLDGGFPLAGDPPPESAVSTRPGSSPSKLGINFGADATADTIGKIKIPGASVEPLGADGTLTNPDSISDIDRFLNNLQRMQSVVNSKYNYLQSMFDSNEEKKISLNKSLSQYQDTDVAAESANIVKEQIRQRSATSMFIQANTQEQFVLNLLP